MPEIWIPYGDVEAMITLQAENMGGLLDPQSEKGVEETERLSERVRSSKQVFVCDTNPTTLDLMKGLAGAVAGTPDLKVHCVSPRGLESALTELKGRVVPAPEPKDDLQLGGALSEPGQKLFVSTARPDPLYGMVDSRVAACIGWVGGAMRAAAEAGTDFEPHPFEKTQAYGAMSELASRMDGASFLTVVPRAGRLRSVLEDAPFDTVMNGFYSAPVTQSKAMILGAGGRGYDDTLSTAVRAVWSPLSGVRKPGEVLLLAECSGGVGSRALEMLVTGRIGPEVRKREKYVPGLEEVHYLGKLREEYNTILMSGLPEIYAKSKLGLATAKGSTEALSKLLHRISKTSKVNVVTRAAECRVELAQGN